MTRLLDPELDGKGYVIVTDNFYSSDTLALALNRRGIGFVGTINNNMTSFPGFERPVIGTVQSGPNAGAPKLGRALCPKSSAPAPAFFGWAERACSEICG